MIALVLGGVQPLRSQQQGRHVEIDRLCVTSLLLKTLVNGQMVGTATGFVVRKGDKHYLITCRHVVSGRDQVTNEPLHPDGLIPNGLAILHNKKGRLGEWRWVRESLYEPETRSGRWIEHPTKGPQVDVVALPLTNLSGVELYPLNLELRNTSVYLQPTDMVSIVGFPFGETAGGGLAIWKTGTIASDLDIDYGGKPVFLIDATTRPAMSGSPVYARRTGAFLGLDLKAKVPTRGHVDRFLGVYAGRIHREAEVGRVWKAEVLLEIYSALP